MLAGANVTIWPALSVPVSIRPTGTVPTPAMVQRALSLNLFMKTERVTFYLSHICHINNPQLSL